MEDRLQKFVKLVDRNNFTRAAESMHLSQPALTTAIKKLERELHTTLLVRTNRGLELTEAGRLAYASGKELIAQQISLKQALANLKNQKIVLSLGMIDSVAETLFTYHNELAELENWAQVSLSVNNSAALVEAVERQELDAAIIAKQSALPRVFASQPLGSEPLVLVTRASQRKNLQKQVRQGVVENFLSYNQNSATYAILQETARVSNMQLNPRFYSTSPDIMLNLVLLGKGSAVLPYLKVRDLVRLNALAIVPLGKKGLVERQLFAIHLKNRHLPVQMQTSFERATGLFKTLLQEAKQR